MITLTTDARFDDMERIMERIARPGNRQQRAITDAIRQRFAENFTRQGSGAGAWAALKPSTVADRRRSGFAGERPVLVRTGSYRASFTDASHAQHYENVMQSDFGTTYEVGSNDPRGNWLERGTALMPARPVTLLDDGQVDRIAQVVEFILVQLDAHN